MRTIRFIIQEYPIGSLLIFGGLVALAVWSACVSSPARNTALRNLKPTLNGLRYAKLIYQDAAATVNRNPQDMTTGERAYREAMAAYNHAITEMRDTLIVLEGALSTDKINELLETADTKGRKFHNWLYPPKNSESGDRGNRNGERGSAQSFIPDPVGVVSLPVQLKQMQEERDRELRAYLINELEKCEWDSWNEVRGR